MLLICCTILFHRNCQTIMFISFLKQFGIPLTSISYLILDIIKYFTISTFPLNVNARAFQTCRQLLILLILSCHNLSSLILYPWCTAMKGGQINVPGSSLFKLFKTWRTRSAAHWFDQPEEGQVAEILWIEWQFYCFLLIIFP